MSIFLTTPGLFVDIHVHDNGRWCAILRFSDETQTSKGDFESKTAAFDWAQQQFDRWRLAA